MNILDKTSLLYLGRTQLSASCEARAMSSR
jgi:hypothetical protein